ncbi:MAG: hypothetical protein AMQ74_01701 [Candidatus Methanofastidiosum methylothiophilum]|jgi:formate-dependent nitrite reductase membrane component NrfD|uniref:Uncharacterized protein n=1 Tax=Candidatus Methanofastidiosum methylothiophilum TaxID=1705564 RepID=A0A150IQB5_9EURY|nr:MAG: hypothetical protein AMQ74_01701 [Candidatus Methanofastidiosum methylthiophilus]
MDTPLHYIKLLDKEQTNVVLVWTFATLVILSGLAYISMSTTTLSDNNLLLEFEIAKDFTISVLILTYLGITSMAVFFVNENNYLRNAVGELYAI